MSGRAGDHGHRARQAGWYRGGDIVLVQQQVSETKATVTIYPKANSTPAADTEPGVRSSPSFPRLEEKVLAYWKSDATFNASVERNPAGNNGANEFVFYDRPPFANGLPHYGPLLTGYVKDIVPRYQTMGGRRVERRFGWDCHGLPAELEAMAQLSLKTKSDIKDLGIATFNQACRESVLRYTAEWQDYVTRQARWVDFDHDYKTLEQIWRGLTGGRSVHLADWPDVAELPLDDDLVEAMDWVREVCSAGSSLRKAGGL